MAHVEREACRRPPADRLGAVNGRFEVPLTGELAPLAAEAGSNGPVRPDDRRRVAVAIALVGAVVAIAVTISLALASDDEDATADGDAPTSVAGPLTAPRPPDATLPPTLPPIAAGAAVALPEHPVVGVLTVDVEFDDAAFDLDTALRRAADDRPRRAVTTIVVGGGDTRLNAVIARSPSGDRYRLLVDGAAPPVELIVDLELGVSFVSVAGDEWRQLPNDEILDGGDGELRSFLDVLLLGPVRPATVSGASVTPGEYVLLTDGSRIARRYDIVIDASDAPIWARYRLGPAADAPPPAAGEPFTIAAYVDEWGDLVQVDGVVAIGPTEQLSLHTVSILPSDFEIALPDVVAPPP